MKAYKNTKFLDSPDARLLRIVSEFVEPATRFSRNDIEDTIVFMGSARAPDSKDELETEPLPNNNIQKKHWKAMARYYQDCRELAKRMTLWSKNLPEGHRRFVVCSGGGPGIMEAANQGASDADGINIGLGISLPNEQGNNPHITRELSLEFHYFFMRKFWFAYMAKAVVFFPGGFGTMDELFEILTLLQTGKIRKHLPLVLFGIDYWKRAVDFEMLIEYGAINRSDLELFLMELVQVGSSHDFGLDEGRQGVQGGQDFVEFVFARSLRKCRGHREPGWRFRCLENLVNKSPIGS